MRQLLAKASPLGQPESFLPLFLGHANARSIFPPQRSRLVPARRPRLRAPLLGASTEEINHLRERLTWNDRSRHVSMFVLLSRASAASRGPARANAGIEKRPTAVTVQGSSFTQRAPAYRV
ncbi:hypothetical protein L226DRAFT_384362 [Lentinus tigrinus ALCF2SS1-7]|uniref:uncharacterized protein n=1 Tax=Lentinus tigrinus ALCF2SS1-7 TaxID=1328758 RepID=UPI001165D221|nr:hypothetical protein L226DRAFT_384362 [Lentinus tigrinus ALCF2SS1-7]